jgi:hypothetical protein
LLSMDNATALGETRWNQLPRCFSTKFASIPPAPNASERSLPKGHQAFQLIASSTSSVDSLWCWRYHPRCHPGGLTLGLEHRELDIGARRQRVHANSRIPALPLQGRVGVDSYNETTADPTTGQRGESGAGSASERSRRRCHELSSRRSREGAAVTSQQHYVKQNLFRVGNRREVLFHPVWGL